MSSQAPSNTYSLPTSLTHSPSNTQPAGGRKSWKQRLDFLSAPISNFSTREDGHGLNRPSTNASPRNDHMPKWWRIQLFRGMINDVRRRAPFYWSDWTDAWDYRVVPATVYMYFANILPALAFSLDMFTKTNMSFGVNEVLLASVLGSVVFAVFAAQPLVIVGVTGPITVFNYTVYDIMVPTGTNYFAFMCWVGLWSLVMHWILAVTNACNALKYVTRFSCDIFGFYVAFIYLQKGIQVLTRQGSEEPFYLSIVMSLLVLVIGYLCGVIGTSPLFQHYIRVFIKDYGTPLTVVFFTGFVHVGKMREVDLSTLPTSKAFFPTTDRSWFIHFWDIRVGDAFIAIPFAILLTILFYFDHNVSSLIAQGTEFPLRKPAGFHWDIFLLGLTTGIAGLLGIPFPNGLIPQAPFHTDSLCVTKVVADPNEEGANKGHVITKVDHVVEQRVSNLAQGLLTLGTMSGPLLVILHLIPQGVLAGLFFVMGVQALEGNGITSKILFLCKDASLTPKSEPLKRIRRRNMIWVFVAIQLIGFGATFAITQTIAAVGFPIIILLLIPFRTFVLPKWFEDEELRLLDAPTASPFTMISVGGNFGEGAEDSDIGGVASGDETAAQSGEVSNTDGMFVDGDSDEGKAERGEGRGINVGVGIGEGMKRRESWRGEGRSGRWGNEEGHELQIQGGGRGVRKRSASRQSK
ncbi:HCO3 transporter family-domain-containing protein [Tricladium varicosporioides]|nr:HCO3 transporter family-domain-containing protein [Hymenoscyphus varicosporioides]